ncbi:MAG: 3-isopropylmalate dehydratase large subunit [Erythrobacter sp.]|uniref:3-isopropylmalate dehydratase large subunit n=1 Tax=Erythrobacter sp. TaxID=1042 RepID=UPI003297D0B5
MTLTQKIIAKACGRENVMPGELVTVSVDLLMGQDASGPRKWGPRLKEFNAKLWDPDKVVVVSDHYVPAVDAQSAEILATSRQFAREYGVKNFFDMQGISHAIMPERGLLRPGMFVAGGDSHTPTAGAFGCYAAGFGATDTTAIAITGETWTTVPETIKVQIDGELGEHVTAKDVMLWLCREMGMENSFKSVEFCGSTVASMSMSERLVLSNMAAELGAEAGIIGVDAVTIQALKDTGGDWHGAEQWVADEGATYVKTIKLDASQLVPQVAAPHAPENTKLAKEFAQVAVDQCYIGACVGAKLEDLQMAATILKGRKVSPTTRLLVAPATVRVTEKAAADGTLAALTGAGAILLPSGCGACAGMGAGIVAQGEVCISTTNRNFQGRMGHKDASVYLASPYTVAASAITGRITDPDELTPLLAEKERLTA